MFGSREMRVVLFQLECRLSFAAIISRPNSQQVSLSADVLTAVCGVARRLACRSQAKRVAEDHSMEDDNDDARSSGLSKSRFHVPDTLCLLSKPCFELDLKIFNL